MTDLVPLARRSMSMSVAMQWLANTWSRFFPNPRYYGWAIVGLGFLASALTSPGQSFAISLYLEPVMAELDLTRVEISSLYAVATLGAALCLPLIGGLADHVPSGRFLAVVIALMGLAMIGFSAIRTAVALGIVLFSLRLLGQGAVGLATLTATVRWFRRYRGRALAVVGLGYAFGQLVFPGLIFELMERLGWRGSLLGLAGVYLLVAAPLIGALMRERRESDPPIDGATRPADGSAAELPPEQSFDLREALRMPVFWGLLACVSIPPLVHTAVIFHQVALFGSAGWEVSLVPVSFVGFALTSVVTTYATGLMLERTGSRRGIALSLGFSALALLMLIFPIGAPAGAIVYGSLLGMASGAHAATNSIVWPEYFGVEALGAVKGVVNGVRNGASAVGPPVAAMLVASTGAFTTSLSLLAALSAGAAIATRWLGGPTINDSFAAAHPQTLADRRRPEEAA